ncbi:MAG: D-alanyl-D-alanine carboxypeptidase/D-alanyl-D-alanine-endopeptidase [Bacteroidota bacterium]
MKKWCFLALLFSVSVVGAQTIKQQMTKAVAQLEAEPEFRHAIIGFCITDSVTGRIIYEHNAETGLAPASTQKLFTSCAAFDLLGKDYRYTTSIGYSLQPLSANSYFVVQPSGDPSFGSSRFASTKPAAILENIVAGLVRNKIQSATTKCRLASIPFEQNPLPGGWIWEDIGNYYGAGAQAFNWLENQYDLVLQSGKKPGDKVSIVTTRPRLVQNFDDRISSAEKGTGDNTVVYLPYGDALPLVNGTIPVNEDAFTVSAAMADPLAVFTGQLIEKIKTSGIALDDTGSRHPLTAAGNDSISNYTELYRHVSPPLDSLNYWFLKKSINLYGEALLKKMAFEKTGFGSTEKGVELLKSFWSQHGIEPSALHICDGSGLSPQNRVTARALVDALQYARTRPWFNSFYYDLPVYNSMKMKSGSIGGARAFAGYHTAKNGKAYCFSILINNYNGSSAATVKKMFRLLDNLK